jgi:hypothetical protein
MDCGDGRRAPWRGAGAADRVAPMKKLLLLAVLIALGTIAARKLRDV